MKRDKIQKSLSKYSIFLLFIAGFIIMLPSWNKYWAPYDEGNYLISARMVMEGMVPYKDFFLVMYPPAYPYVLAALFSIFGVKFIVSRLFTVFLISTICTCVFYITKKVSSFKYGLIAFVVILSTMAAWGEPPIPRPVWPGVTLSLLSIACFINFIEKEKIRYLLYSGFLVALATMFRHDIGFLTFLSALIGIITYSIYRHEGKKAVKLSALYFLFPVLFISFLMILLYKANAIQDAKMALFSWPLEFGKWCAVPFPKFCFNFNMIFHRGCLFIRNNKFYIPIIVCATSGLFYIGEIWKKKCLDKRIIYLSVLIPLGVFYLEQLVFRTDGNHLAVSFPPTAILFGLLFTCEYNIRRRLFKVIKIILIAYVTLLMVLFFYRNTEKYIKDIFIKPYIKKSIEPVAFKQGTLYLPDDGRDTFVALTEYIEQNTEPGEKIYIGHLKHNVPQMGWFDLLYFVTDTFPAVKYHVMMPGFQSRADIQEKMIDSLRDNNVKIVLLRDFGESDTLGPLDKYIRKEYTLDKMIDSYHIYAKK